MLVGLWLLRFERADGCIFVVDVSDERARSRARGMQDLRSRGDKHGRKAGFISCVTKFRSIQHAREKTACGTVHYTNTHSISSLQIRPAHQLSRLYLASSLQLVKWP